MTQVQDQNTQITNRRRSNRRMPSNRSTFWKLLAIAAGITLGVGGGMALAARNSSGTHSLPAGNPFVPGTTISSSVVNSTLADISAEITDSLSRSGKGGMTAPFRVVDGTAAAPSLSFTSETGSGLYRAGASDVGISVAGTRRLRIQPTGVTVPNDLTVTGAATVGTTLGVTGHTTLSTVGTSGLATLASASVTGSASVGTTLGVTGATTLSNTLTVNGTTVTLSAADVSLTEAATQSITKSGGTLQVGTSDAQDVDLRRNGASVLLLGSSGPAFTGKPTATATASGDGSTTLTTKGYVDAAADQKSAVSGTCGTSGTDIATFNYVVSGKLTFHFVLYMAATSAATAAVRCTPSASNVGTLALHHWGANQTTASAPSVTTTTGTATNTTAAVGSATVSVIDVTGHAYVISSGSPGTITCQCLSTTNAGTISAGSYYTLHTDA